MKRLGIITMILGVLFSSSSIFFTVINRQYNMAPIILFWGLLTGFEIFFAWTYLFSKTQTFQHSQKLTIATLVALTLLWILLVHNNTYAPSIFSWALKTLNYSGLYFIGLAIYYRATQT